MEKVFPEIYQKESFEEEQHPESLAIKQWDKNVFYPQM